MRFAISAVAAISGLFLLGVAFYGQPALYLHQARDEWHLLMNTPPADQPVDPDHDFSVDRVARLQLQVAELEDALAAKQAPTAAVPVQAAPVVSAPAPSALAQIGVQPTLPAISAPTQASVGQPAAQPTQPVVSQPMSVMAPTAVPAPAQVAAPLQTQASVPAPTQTPAQAPAALTQTGGRTGGSRVTTVQLEKALQFEGLQTEPPRVAARAADPGMPTDIVSMRHEANPAEAVLLQPDKARAESAKTEQSKASQAKSDAAKVAAITVEPPKFEPPKSEAAKTDGSKSEASKSEASKSGSQKLVVLKPIPVPLPAPVPAPPPAPQSSTATRQDTDDARSVLARLRQLPAAAAQQASAPQADVSPPIESKARPASPSLPGLSAARAALANGRIEDARRLLQQAQLQLVFRPINLTGDDSLSAGRAAADVAHALDSLSANDISLSRRYIDVAIGDLSGTGTSVPVQESQVRTTGYAPAYPPR